MDAFLSVGPVDFFAESLKSPQQIRLRFRHDKPMLEKVLQWKDLLDEGTKMLGLLRLHQIPPRAAYMLYYFILFAPAYLKDIEQKLYADGELSAYSCTLNCMWPGLLRDHLEKAIYLINIKT
jgi:hypothetical protein